MTYFNSANESSPRLANNSSISPKSELKSLNKTSTALSTAHLANHDMPSSQSNSKAKRVIKQRIQTAKYNNYQGDRIAKLMNRNQLSACRNQNKNKEPLVEIDYKDINQLLSFRSPGNNRNDTSLTSQTMDI